MGLLADLDVFFTDHMRCGDLDAGVEGQGSGSRVIAAPAWPGESMRMTLPTAIELDSEAV